MGDAADMAMEAESFRSTYGSRYDPGLGYGLPIHAVRGGIKYPKPERTTMSGRITKTNSEALAIAAAAKRIAGEQLIEEANELEARAAVLRRPEPSKGQGRWAIDVRFTTGGKLYQFLVLRAGNRYYTTGTGEASVFPSWRSFLAWLDANVVEHSAMIPLESDFSADPALEGKRA